jgi:hypothetical protein
VAPTGLFEFVADIPHLPQRDTASSATHASPYNYTVGAVTLKDANRLSFLVLHFSPDPFERLTRRFQLQVSAADVALLQRGLTNRGNAARAPPSSTVAGSPPKSAAVDAFTTTTAATTDTTTTATAATTTNTTTTAAAAAAAALAAAGPACVCASLKVSEQTLNRTTAVHDMIESELFNRRMKVAAELRSVDVVSNMATAEGLAHIVANAGEWMEANRRSLRFAPYVGSVAKDIGAKGGCLLEFELETPAVKLLRIEMKAWGR